jgi:Spy/CpxP family protein refolding chaperone
MKVGLIGLAAGLALSVAFVPGGSRAAKAAGTASVQSTTPTPAPQQQAPPAQGRGASVTPPSTDGRTGGPGGRAGGPGIFREWEWWKDDEVKREIALTDKTAAEIDNIFQSRLRQAMPFIDAYNREKETLDKMTRERTVDESTYGVQVAQVVALQSKVLESRTVMLYRIYMKLSAEQYKKLNDARDRHYQRGRGGNLR